MPSFFNIRNSRPEEYCKKCVLKINILENSLKDIHDAVLTLTFKISGKRSETLLKRDSGICAFLRISQMF